MLRLFAHFVLRRPVAITCLLLFVGWASAQSLPSRLTFLRSSGLSISIEQPVYQPANQSPTGPLTGSGSYTIAVGGQTVFQGSNFAFAGILADSSGQVKPNAAGYAIPKDIVWKNLLGTGTDLTIPTRSKIVVSGGSGAVSVAIQGAATAVLPFRLDGGSRSQIAVPHLNLIGTSTGAISLDADVSLTNGPNLAVGGFGVAMTSPHLGLAKPATNADGHVFHLSSPLAKVTGHLPSLLTTDPFELAATQVSIDETGTPSCATLSIGQAVASTAGGDMATLPVIGLAKPINFGIRPRSISASLKAGVLSLSSLSFDLILPEMLTDTAGAPAEIDGVQFAPATGKFTLPALPGGGLKLRWKPATLGTVDIDLTAATFDSSAGLSHVSGSLTVGAGGGPLSSGGGAPLTLALQDFSIGANGPTGVVGVQGGSSDASIWNLPVTLKGGSVTFDEGEVTGGDLSATMKGTFAIGLEVGVSKTGCAIAVNTGDVESPSFGGMKLTLTGGSVAVDGKGNATVLVSGSATVPVPPPLTSPLNLSFTNLGIVNGSVVAGSLKLTSPTKIDLGPVTLKLTELAYQANPEAMTLTGDVSVPDVLGAGANVSFEGLTISAGKPLSVKVGGIGIDCKIPGLGTFAASVDPAGPDFNGFIRPLTGSADVSIEGLPSFAAAFMLSKNGAWVLALAADFPQEMLPSLALVPPYGSPSPPFLYLLGVHGAIGYGVALKPGTPATNDNLPNDQTLARYEYDSQHPNNWLVQMGIDVGTIDEYLLWGPLTLSVAIPAVDVDLQGQVYLLADRLSSTSIPRTGDNSRYATFDLNYKAPDTFTAKGQVNIQLGISPLVYKVFGTLEAEFSPSRGYLYAGYPVDTNGFGSEFAGIGSKVGFGIDLWPPQNGVQAALHAGMVQYANFFGIVKGERGLDFGMSIPTQGVKASIYVDAYMEGDVDFGVISAYARVEGGASWTIGQLPDLTGDFRAGVHTLLGDVDVDTGTVHILGS